MILLSCRSNIDALNREVDEVKGVMRENVNKVIERGDHLSHLEGRAEELNQAGGHFQKTAVRYKRKKQFGNAKLWLLLICIIVVILIVIAGIGVGLGLGLS